MIYETIYDNRNNYSEPERYPDRRYKVYTFPPVQDPEDEKVELKILSDLDESYISVSKSSDGSTQLVFDKENTPFDRSLNSTTGGKETYKETVWLSLEDSYGNVVYFFLRAIFIPPVVPDYGNFVIQKNFTFAPKDCKDKILTANITEIDEEALVKIRYSQELHNAMFRNSSIEDKHRKIPRSLSRRYQSNPNSTEQA